MFPVLLVLSLFSLAAGDAPETVLVRDVEVASDGESLFGWRRVPASEAEGREAIPNARLELLGDPFAEPLASEQWPLSILDVARAWRSGTGSPEMVIAVIDSGLALDHPDLADRIFINPGEIPGNGIDDDGNGFIDDVNGWDFVSGDNDPSDGTVGHGTEVAGVAVASLNGIGIAGIAPTVTVLPIRACTSSCELFNVAWAVRYAVDTGADIINLSIGGFAEPGPLADAVDYAEEAGVLVVAAAGNSGTSIDGLSFVPAALPNPNLIAVAATDQSDRIWSNSNYGPDTVDIGAPGVAVLTTTLEHLGGYRKMTGTSFAAPHVSATAALMLSIRDLEPPALIELLGRHGLGVSDLAARTRFGTRLRSAHAVTAAGLRDIHDSIFDREIVWLALEEITRGCNPPANDRFCPDQPVTRGQMAAFLTRALNLPPGPDAFTDDNGHIFEADINALARAYITRGCNPPANDGFCPDQPVTRGQMAAFLARALGG